ncbi:MAG: outer membrane lipoprotein carrier protein LolA [Phycisphaerales bacterium JB054]
MLTAITVMTKLVAVLAAMLSWQAVRPADAPAPAGEAVVAAEPIANTSNEPVADAAPAQPASESIADDYTDADELLSALETAGNDVRQLSAVVRYVKTFAIQGDTQQRDGTLAFVSTPAGAEAGATPDRRFAIEFQRLELDNGRRIEDASTGYRERYIFDGEWLAEVRPFDKQFIRRQVVAPGDKWDPLRLGEGPFPIPIQQRRADILARFDAELLDGLDGVEERGLRGVAGKCYQLRLTPKAEANEKELREIRVWYQRDTLLPRMAKTISQADDESFVLLKDLLTNADAKVSEAELTTALPVDRAGWNITVEPYAG